MDSRRHLMARLKNLRRCGGELIDSTPRIVNIRGLERVLKDGCLAQLVERRPYKA